MRYKLIKLSLSIKYRLLVKPGTPEQHNPEHGTPEH